MPSPRPPVSEPIARGNTSDVWPWTERTVVKVLRPHIPDHWAEIEAGIISRVHAAGLPVPATDGVVRVEGRPGIVLERIDGDSMWEQMKADPSDVPSLTSRLVDLQTELQRTQVDGLPDLFSRVTTKIERADQLPLDDRQQAQALLASLPSGSAVCHGDFHPANIILSERGPIILDWFDAVAGHTTADFVRSSLLMRPPEEPGSWLSGATPELLDRVHSCYVSELVGRGLIEAETFGPWEAVAAVARLSEPVPGRDLVAIWQRWQSEGSAAAAALIERCLAQTAGQPGDA